MIALDWEERPGAPDVVQSDKSTHAGIGAFGSLPSKSAGGPRNGHRVAAEAKAARALKAIHDTEARRSNEADVIAIARRFLGSAGAAKRAWRAAEAERWNAQGQPPEDMMLCEKEFERQFLEMFTAETPPLL